MIVLIIIIEIILLVLFWISWYLAEGKNETLFLTIAVIIDILTVATPIVIGILSGYIKLKL